MKTTMKECIPDTVQGLEIFIKECNKEVNRWTKIQNEAQAKLDKITNKQKPVFTFWGNMERIVKIPFMPLCCENQFNVGDIVSILKQTSKNRVTVQNKSSRGCHNVKLLTFNRCTEPLGGPCALSRNLGGSLWLNPNQNQSQAISSPRSPPNAQRRSYQLRFGSAFAVANQHCYSARTGTSRQRMDYRKWIRDQ